MGSRRPKALRALTLAREQTHPSSVENGAFPHAPTELVDEIAIGAPERLVNDYLICVGTLVRLVKDDAIRMALLESETLRQFLGALTANL